MDASTSEGICLESPSIKNDFDIQTAQKNNSLKHRVSIVIHQFIKTPQKETRSQR